MERTNKTIREKLKKRTFKVQKDTKFKIILLNKIYAINYITSLGIVFLFDQAMTLQ